MEEGAVEPMYAFFTWASCVDYEWNIEHDIHGSYLLARLSQPPFNHTINARLQSLANIL